MKIQENKIPLVSVITPTFNSADYLEECIESVMNQTYVNLEHIIMDGGSTDNTLNILKKYEGKYNMRYYSETDKGMYDAIVKGMEKSKGDILCWLNSDDMYFKGALEIISNTIKVTECDWCTGIPSKYSENGINFGIKRHTTVYYQPFLKKGYYDGRILPIIQQESVFWTKQLWEKVNAHDIREYQYAGDYALWKMFAQEAELYTIDCVISGFRKHAGQKSDAIGIYRKEQGEIKLYVKILKKLKFYKLIAGINNIFDKKHYIRYSMISH